MSVCVRSKPVNQTVGAINAYSFKIVKATDFKFDAPVSRDIPYIFLEKGCGQGHVKNHSWEICTLTSSFYLLILWDSSTPVWIISANIRYCLHAGIDILSSIFCRGSVRLKLGVCGIGFLFRFGFLFFFSISVQIQSEYHNFSFHNAHFEFWLILRLFLYFLVW